MRKAIVFALLVAPALGDDAQAARDALKKEFEAAVDEFFRPQREAQARGDKAKLDWEKHPDVTFASRFLAFAKQYPKTDAAEWALMRAIRTWRDEATRGEAVEILLRDHRDSAGMKNLVNYLKPDGFRLLAEKSPHAEVRGYALLRLAESRVKDEPEAAMALLREVKEKYGDLPGWGAVTLGQQADGDIYEIEHLGIGKTTPEIEGEDLDGKPMKLSDFKGRVVVLDFWGDW